MLVGEGAGGTHSDDWRESLALYGVCILCGRGSREGRGGGMTSLFPVWKENRVCSDDEDRDGGIIHTDCLGAESGDEFSGSSDEEAGGKR